jgi:salicylate hydroxylase
MSEIVARKLIAWDGKEVFIGDANHPLSGAFGSGAPFALEDGWILASAVEYTRSSGGLKEALEILLKLGARIISGCSCV